jgi:hypothetical protein
MKHITFGDNSLLVGDDVADALLDYAAFLTTGAAGDTVEVHAISSDGDYVIASFLLGPGVTMMAETTHNKLPEPENTAAITYMNKATAHALVRPTAMPDDDVPLHEYDEMSADLHEYNELFADND